QSRQGLVEPRLPLHRPAPLTHRTESYPTEPGVLQFEFFGRGIAGELKHLAALRNPFTHTLMAPVSRGAVDHLYFVSFPAVNIPRLMLGAQLGKKVALTDNINSWVDFVRGNAYTKNVRSRTLRHFQRPSKGIELVTPTLEGLSLFCNSPPHLC